MYWEITFIKSLQEASWSVFRKNLRNTVTAHMNHVRKKIDVANVFTIIGEWGNYQHAFLAQNMKRHMTALSQTLFVCIKSNILHVSNQWSMVINDILFRDRII